MNIWHNHHQATQGFSSLCKENNIEINSKRNMLDSDDFHCTHMNFSGNSLFRAHLFVNEVYKIES